MADRKCPKKVRAFVERALSAANLTNANFGREEMITYNGKKISVDSFVKEKIRLYNQTWISVPLRQVLDWADK